ncbi:hypothetical protein ACTQ75_000890 [Vibrio alginolyticus]|nr:hypothetical protein [Vibrio alginolyticus]
MPKPPAQAQHPTPITLDCVEQAKTFPDLELCRQQAEAARELVEDFNKIMTKFCDSLLKVDGKLRKKAKEGKINWEDYEEIKEDIVEQLNECDPNNGVLFASYRARIREYKRIMAYIPKRKETIIKGVGL